MSKWFIASGAALVALSLAWAGLLVWRLQEGAVGPSDGETAQVVVSFGWVQIMGAVGLMLASMGILARMRRRNRPRL